MSDIRAWLDGLDLGDHADLFEAEQIAVRDLPSLSDADLKDLGLPLGPRRRILNALKDRAPAAVPEAPTAQAAERRQLTVMFCDLVGSTALSEQLDPEDLRALMAAYRDAVGAVVKIYDGHIAQYLGDGVMVYFGWPRAHEDDAERAVRAALDAVDAVKPVAAPALLQVRIGIATGPVVVGDSGDDADRLAVGETPNLAARLQGLAGPDQIVIGPGTHHLVGGAFDYDDLGPRNLKGIVEPVPAWRVTGASAAQGRFEAQAVAGLTPFVGREEEVGLLLRRWQRAADGEGQVVLLSGEPGIGKSRLLQVLRDRVADDPHTRLRYQCSPYHTNSAFYPVIDQLERAAGFARGDSTDQKLDKLEAVLEPVADGRTATALIASMLSLPVDRYPPLNLAPQRQKDETGAALAEQVRLLAARRPVLMLFEDAHWCDPTTLETFGAVIERIRDAPVLLVITARPEFDPPWTGHGHFAVQSLTRLSRREGADLVHRATGGKPLPDAILDQIVAKTDGVPLFVEELTKTVLESGILTDIGDGYELSGPLPALAIPTTLQDSLMARLDRLSPIKEVAQIGACIGREFSFELVAAVSPLSDNALADALQQLVDSELMFRRGTPPDATYIFKHALVRDSAYQTLLKSRRQQIHLRLAETVVARFADRVEQEPEIPAQHYAAAGQSLEAARYWLRAGSRSLASMALPEARAQFDSGIDQIALVAAGDDRDRLELDLRSALGTTLMAVVGWPASEVAEALQPAPPLARKLRDDRALASVLWGLWLNLACRGLLRDSLGVIEEMNAAALRSPESDLPIVRDEAASCTHFWMADYDQGWAARERLLAAYDEERHGHIVHYTVHDPKVVAHMWSGSHVKWITGYPDQALAEVEEMLAWARHIGHPFNTIHTLTNGCRALGHMGLIDRYEQHLEEARSIVRELGWQFAEDTLIGGDYAMILFARGEFERGYQSMRAGIDIWEGMGGALAMCYAYGLMANALLRLGRLREARDHVDHGLSVGEQREDLDSYPNTVRIKGEIAMASGADGYDEAESLFRQAIELSQKQKAKAWELRAATSLARLWAEQGERRKAHDLLAPVYGWFTEGFDTADLRDAKALLDDLSD